MTLALIARCPSQWPNAENCLKVKAAITLNPIPTVLTEVESIGSATNSSKQIDVTTELPEDDENEPKPPVHEQELTSEHLVQMWLQFGRKVFEDGGFLVGATGSHHSPASTLY